MSWLLPSRCLNSTLLRIPQHYSEPLNITQPVRYYLPKALHCLYSTLVNKAQQLSCNLLVISKVFHYSNLLNITHYSITTYEMLGVTFPFPLSQKVLSQLNIAQHYLTLLNITQQFSKQPQLSKKVLHINSTQHYLTFNIIQHYHEMLPSHLLCRSPAAFLPQTSSLRGT